MLADTTNLRAAASSPLCHVDMTLAVNAHRLMSHRRDDCCSETAVVRKRTNGRFPKVRSTRHIQGAPLDQR
jgi:hypothetical protein